jgi:hypothetical protein
MTLVAIALLGCGGGDGAGGSTVNPYANRVYEPSGRFLEILHDLERTASSGQRGHAVRQARGLSEVERKVINEFCYFTFRMRANREVHLSHGDRAYAFSAIMRYAAYKRSRPFDELVKAALIRLQTIIAPASLGNQQLKRYQKACGRLAPFSPTPWGGAPR